MVSRFRPLNKLELTKGSRVCIGNLTKESVQLKTQDGSAYNFTFDRVFGTTSSQLDVWEDVGRPIVESLFQGFNGCLLAYGQTGACARGKRRRCRRCATPTRRDVAAAAAYPHRLRQDAHNGGRTHPRRPRRLLSCTLRPVRFYRSSPQRVDLLTQGGEGV